MKLIMIAAAATIALTAPVLAQVQSEPANTVGSGTAKALDPGPPHEIGTPVAPSSMNGASQKAATARNQSGAAPKNGTQKPDGTTGAPPYGSIAPKPDSSSGANPDVR